MQFLSTWKLLQNKSMPVIGTRWRNNTQKSHELLKEKKINTTHLLLTSMQQIKPFGLYNENGAVPHTHDRLRRYPPNALAVFAYLAKSGCILYIVRTKKAKEYKKRASWYQWETWYFSTEEGKAAEAVEQACLLTEEWVDQRQRSFAPQRKE